MTENGFAIRRDPCLRCEDKEQSYMGRYLCVLEMRAVIEGVEL